MHRFAQTNIQLINQMHRDGYQSNELGSVLNAYDFAMRLFTARYRGSGKTFLAHLVGTASILASHRVSTTLVVAALLHAAYDSGDFGDGVQGISDTKRNLVRSVIGEEAEEHVARYASLRWNPSVMKAVHDDIAILSPSDRAVILMRLANELEDYLDLGILYCGHEKRQAATYSDNNGKLMIRIAEMLGFPALGADMETAFKEVAESKAPPSLPASLRDFSFLVVPQSYQRLMEVLERRLSKTKAEA